MSSAGSDAVKVSENLLTVRKGTAMKVWGAVLITNKRYGYGEGEFDGCAQTCRGRFGICVLYRQRIVAGSESDRASGGMADGTRVEKGVGAEGTARYVCGS